jgi:hypothetical protein
VLVVLIIGVGRDFDDVVQVLLCHVFESRQTWLELRRNRLGRDRGIGGTRGRDRFPGLASMADTSAIYVE